MKKIIYLVILACTLLGVQGCSDDIAEEVYHPKKEVNTERVSSLTVKVENADPSMELVVGIFSENLFNELGESHAIKETDFLYQKELKDNQAFFEDIMGLFDTEVFVNVLRKEEQNYVPLTNLASQVEYHVTFGDVVKHIDLNEPAPEVIKKTTFSVSVAPEYAGKTLFLIDESLASTFEEQLKAGNEPSEDLYLDKSVVEEGKGTFIINTPLNEKNYLVYLIAPEEGIAWLKRTASNVNYNTEEVTLEFEKELPKKIVVTAIRGGENLSNHEAYLITKENWPKVEDIVKNQHGHPEAGLYVKKDLIMNGNLTFEVFCTEGSQEYVVYIPKWNSEYYDSYQQLSVVVVPETAEYPLLFDFPYVPVGGGGGITKTVAFNVHVDKFEGFTFGYMGAYVYILNDAENLTAALNKLESEGTLIEGLTRIEHPIEMNDDLPIDLNISDIEISTDKEIAVFMTPVMKGIFDQRIGIVRIPGANIVSPYAVSLTIETLEARPY